MDSDVCVQKLGFVRANVNAQERRTEEASTYVSLRPWIIFMHGSLHYIHINQDNSLHGG